MARRAAAVACVVALGLAARYAALPFLGPSSLQTSSWAPPATLGAPLGAPRAGLFSQAPAQAEQASERADLSGTLACGCVAVALLARFRGRQLLRSARAASRRGWMRGLTARRAEDGSILGSLAEEDRQEEEESQAIEQEMQKEDEMFDTQFDEQNLDGTVTVEEMSAEEAARRGERQIKYKLYPSRHYVLYIAKKNAERIWAKDGPKGPGTNKGCLEVQIALLTERIRSMVLHVRDFQHDFKCRLKLVSMVSRRRKMLDKLSWKDLDAYLKIREELKIRHTYRMEVLIGRLPEYKYAIRDRIVAPGRKPAMRLKKSKRLLARRLATQLRQGKNRMVIHKTKKKIKGRKWLARAYDEVEWMVAGKAPQQYVDPLNLP